MNRPAGWRSAMLVWAAAGTVSAQPTSVVYGPHNLSAGGTGPVRAVMEDQVCIFCHTPHNASPIKPLWNRALPVEAYTIYRSNSLDALPDQPTGTSKMCLSCHDGTIALGSVVSRDMPIQMAGGITTMPAGSSLLGTDLSDDHPISFRYDSGLAAKDNKLRQPSSLPHQILLDRNAELQCTSCHDAHNNVNGNFLVMNNDQSQLCLSCHQVGTTSITGHQQCSACHQPHTAPSGPYLLRAATVSQTCVSCHDGSVAGAANIAGDLNKPWVHDTNSPVDPPGHMSEHTSCSSCHDPHTMQPGAGRAPSVHPSFGKIAGMSASGSFVNNASYEFEVCFKCHGMNSNIQPTVPRQITATSMLAQFSPSAVSSHPVEAPGHNNQVPSLKPGWTTGSMVYCSDCHGSDSGSKGGGSGPDGTHGSHNGPLLTARYDTEDYTTESASAYALCYTCHDRNSILSENSSFKGHRKHIVKERTPCAACHDAHGIPSGQGNSVNNSNLINFATGIVLPDPRTGRLEFRDTGMFRGECFLSCHGKDHSPLKYED
ncbi:MAG: hypothetical protein GIKADHBN_03533 [Phycisphaerales bacterium]|nr:hypothetical protein [Phycisphaerales bacterium]